MGITLKEEDGDNLGITKMGNSLNEVLPFLLQMVIFQEFQKWIFGNDGVIWKFRNARRNRNGATHEITKSKMSQNPRFHSTAFYLQ